MTKQTIYHVYFVVKSGHNTHECVFSDQEGCSVIDVVLFTAMCTLHPVTYLQS